MFLLMLTAATQQLTPFEWAVQHIQLIGWPAVLVAAWKISRFLVKIEERALSAEKSIIVITESNKELKDTLAGQVTAQHELAASVNQLAEAIHQQTGVHAEQLSLIREMIGEQKVLAANQMAIMNGFQRVVEQLIDAVADEPKKRN
jgi:hypothetical protein